MFSLITSSIASAFSVSAPSPAQPAAINATPLYDVDTRIVLLFGTAVGLAGTVANAFIGQPVTALVFGGLTAISIFGVKLIRESMQAYNKLALPPMPAPIPTPIP